MADARTQSRSSVEILISAWLAGDRAAISTVCVSDIRWWTPLSGETVTGIDASYAELKTIRRLFPLRLTVTALAVNDNGTTAVVEMRSDAVGEGALPNFVTSVLSLTAGKVTEGRTYVDARAHDRRREPAS